MKKIYLIAAVIGIVALSAVYLSTQKVKGQIASVTTLSPVVFVSGATTTPTAFLNTGKGTTTLPFFTSHVDEITVLIRAFATTTANTNNNPTLSIERQASYDGIDWFTYDQSPLSTSISLFNATSSLPLASTTVPLYWTPSVMGATTTKAFIFPLFPAPQTRLVFSMPTTTVMATAYRDGMNIWVQVIGQRLPSQ